jgi:hypothetical protein
MRSRALVAANAIEFVQKFNPVRAVVSGQGWSFAGRHAHLNSSFFSVDNRWLTAAARTLAPHVDWHEGTPGLRFTLRASECSIDRSDAIHAGGAVSREFDPESVRVAEPFPPWSGIEELSLDRLRKVRGFIVEDFARVLGAHAPKLMERLYYLKVQRSPDLSSTLAICLRNGGARYWYELDYGHLAFREMLLQPTRPAAVGFELWAADLELLLAAQEEVFLLYESAVRVWSRVPSMIELPMLMESFLWFTPRFRSREILDFYQARIAALRGGGAAAARV